MQEETRNTVGKVTLRVSAEWPEEDRKALGAALEEYRVALDAANEKADALMEKMQKLQEIGFRFIEV